MASEFVPYIIDDDNYFDSYDILTVDARSIGATGLRFSAGVVMEEILRDLQGLRGIFRYQEMILNDSICGATMQLIMNLVRSCQWGVKAASGHPCDQEAADFLEQCMHDMQGSWNDHVCEFMSMAPFGFSVHEMVLKQRRGGDPRGPFGSKYCDGRFGWKYLPIRSQDSITAWDIRPDGSIFGFRQECAPNFRPIDIEMSKCLHFRTVSHKNNPLGRSIFRSAYLPYKYKNEIQVIEGIGIERELAGLPVMGVPMELLAKNANDSDRAMRGQLAKMMSNVRAGEKASIMYPTTRDSNGNPLFEFKLLSSGGSRAIDTDKVIQRYKHDIAIAAQTDFMLLGSGGSGSSGSWAMHEDKTRIFVQSVGAFLDIICDELNNKAVPYLMSCNSLRMSDYPKIQYSGLEKTDMAALGQYLTQLAGAGMTLFPDDDIERACLKAAGLPEKPNDAPGQKPPAIKSNTPGTGGVKMLTGGQTPAATPHVTPGMNYQTASAASK